jgi:hypothetical protein
VRAIVLYFPFTFQGLAYYDGLGYFIIPFVVFFYFILPEIPFIFLFLWFLFLSVYGRLSIEYHPHAFDRILFLCINILQGTSQERIKYIDRLCCNGWRHGQFDRLLVLTVPFFSIQNKTDQIRLLDEMEFRISLPLSLK